MCPTIVRYCIDGFCRRRSWRQSFLDLPCARENRIARVEKCRFLRRIYCDSTTRVEFAGMTRGQFLMAKGVRQGCPASGFLFAMAFDPIFRWFQDAIIPRNPDGLDFLQPSQCAYADDLAVAAFSFWGLMTALAPAFQTADQKAHRKCFWVQKMAVKDVNLY